MEYEKYKLSETTSAAEEVGAEGLLGVVCVSAVKKGARRVHEGRQQKWLAHKEKEAPRPCRLM